MKPNIAIIRPDQSLLEEAFTLSQRLNIPLIESTEKEYYTAVLIFNLDTLSLQLIGPKAPGPIWVDFISGKYAHRRKYGGGRSQLIAKAVGLKSLKCPSVLDLTAGLGQDAFVLACLGCSVTMIERSLIIAALVQNAMNRARDDVFFTSLTLQLMVTDSLSYLKSLSEKECPDVIYIDPMFPHRTKSALVKKEMRVLREIVGEDIDAGLLLEKACEISKKRVVVKRPRHAPHLNERKPDLEYFGESSRFDVYIS
ncbi:MAG: class I SAM-dependent methyltransferase [Gammaproteobacteria bacterium]|nr:class I SAM-dependent methyltransferase [Gammaproteobacteria bacterium]